jgi:hypothetical protein
MRTSFKLISALVFTAASVHTSNVYAADGDVSFDALMEQYRGRPVAASQWRNELMAAGTGDYSSQSADSILTATLRIYTRDVLDRGYWINSWVDGASGYDSGNPLFAVIPGSGVTIRVARLGSELITAGAATKPLFSLVHAGL